MKLININQVMDKVGCSSRQTVYNWVRAGKLPAPVKKFGSPMWQEAEINEEIQIVRINTEIHEK